MAVLSRASVRLALAAGALALGGCTQLVQPDESKLSPAWCSDPPAAPTLLFPRPNSGVLGIVPIWGEPSDCSGVKSAHVRLLRNGMQVDEMTAALSGDRFAAFWDTAQWMGSAATLQAAVEPVRTSVEEEVSGQVQVQVFGFDPPASTPPVSGCTTGGGRVFIDFNGDGRTDMLWDGAMYENNGSWPFDDISTAAFADYCVESTVDPCHEPQGYDRCQQDPKATCWNGHPLGYFFVADLTADGVPDFLLLPGRSCSTRLRLIPGKVDSGHWKAAASPIDLSSTPIDGGVYDVRIADFDLDGWLDVLAVVACAPSGPGCAVPAADYLFKGEPGGQSWTLVANEDTGLDPSDWDSSAAVGDFLGDDGYPDLVIARELGAPSVVYRNRGSAAGPRFEKVVGAFRLPSTSPAELADYDRDGALDVVFPQSQNYQPPALWRNAGDGTFSDVTAASGYRGGSLADINNDGFLDAGGALGTPDGRFVQTGIDTSGIAVDLGLAPTNPALALVRGPGQTDLSKSTLIGTGRIVARVRLAKTLPGNRLGLGTRVRIWDAGDDPEHPAPGGFGRSTAEISSEALLGFEASFGVDISRRYALEFRLPTLAVVRCAGVPPNSIVTVSDEGGEPTC